jgi:mutator protein MutT
MTQVKLKRKVRAVAIIISDQQVVLMERKKQNQHYFVFPGGGVESGESVKQAVLREVKEETGMKVKPTKLIYHHHYIGHSDQYFYLCQHLSGEPKLGNFNEKQDMQQHDDQFYLPQWVRLDQLEQMLVYPLEIRDWLLNDIRDDFASTPRAESLFVDELRQSLD